MPLGVSIEFGALESCDNGHNMSFNLFVVAAAVIVGIGAGLAGLSKTPVRWDSVFRTGTVGAIGAGLALIITVAGTGRDPLAYAHILYTILGISVPLAAFILFVRVRGSNLLRAVLVLMMVPAPLALYATYIEPFWLKTERVSVPVESEAAGLRIGVLADLQTTAIGPYENEAIDRLIEEQPDVVLIAGDVWELPADEFEARKPEFAALLARLDTNVEHVVAVNGDHDNYLGILDLAQGTDIIVLDNEVIELESRGLRIRIAGLSIGGNELRRMGALAQLPEGDATITRVLLAHNPDVVFELPDNAGIDLTVAGHTHGGQINFPVLGPLVTATEQIPRSVAAGGLHEVNGNRIYVSSGVGRVRDRAPQVRFGARPSVGIIDFFDPTIADL